MPKLKLEIEKQMLRISKIHVIHRKIRRIAEIRAKLNLKIDQNSLEPQKKISIVLKLEKQKKIIWNLAKTIHG